MFINVQIFQSVTSSDHSWFADKLDYVQWLGATSFLRTSFLLCFNSLTNEWKTCIIRHKAYFAFISRHQHLQIISFFFFFVEKIKLFLPKSQLPVKGLLQSLSTYFGTVDISFCVKSTRYVITFLKF